MRPELREQAGLVLSKGFGKQPPLCSGHDLGLGIELPAAQPGKLEVELVDLGLRQGELTATAGHFLRVGRRLLLQPLDQRGHLGRQARQIRGGGNCTGHAQHGAASEIGWPLAIALSTAERVRCGGSWPVHPNAARAVRGSVPPVSTGYWPAPCRYLAPRRHTTATNPRTEKMFVAQNCGRINVHLDWTFGMTKIKNVKSQNPRNSGRKPLPEDEKKVKTSVSLLPSTLAFLTKKGGGVVSHGIEVVVAKAQASAANK